MSVAVRAGLNGLCRRLKVTATDSASSERLHDILTVVARKDMTDTLARRFGARVRNEILRRPAGIMVDLSRLDVVDSYLAQVLCGFGRLAAKTGVPVVVCGIRPEVALVLAQMQCELAGVTTATSLDEGKAVIRQRPNPASRREECGG